MTIDRSEQQTSCFKNHTSAMNQGEQADEDSVAAPDCDDVRSIDAAAVAEAQRAIMDHLCRLIAEDWLRIHSTKNQSNGGQSETVVLG